MACPLTQGSLGSWISLGTISTGGGFFEEVVSDANIRVRGRKEEADWLIGVLDDGLEGSIDVAGGTGRVAELSEAADWDRDEIGGIKF
jgi:hypothetical protein